MRRRLSSGEWDVMTALWKAGNEASVDDIRYEMDDDVSYATVRTVLHRCIQKGWVRMVRKRGRRYFTARVTRRQGVHERAAEIFAELTKGDEEAIEYVRTSLARDLGFDGLRRDNGGDGAARKKRPPG